MEDCESDRCWDPPQNWPVGKRQQDPKKELVGDFTSSQQTQGNIIQDKIEHGTYFKPPTRNVGVVKPYQSEL